MNETFTTARVCSVCKDPTSIIPTQSLMCERYWLVRWTFINVTQAVRLME